MGRHREEAGGERREVIEGSAERQRGGGKIIRHHHGRGCRAVEVLAGSLERRQNR